MQWLQAGFLALLLSVSIGCSHREPTVITSSGHSAGEIAASIAPPVSDGTKGKGKSCMISVGHLVDKRKDESIREGARIEPGMDRWLRAQLTAQISQLPNVVARESELNGRDVHIDGEILSVYADSGEVSVVMRLFYSTPDGERRPTLAYGAGMNHARAATGNDLSTALADLIDRARPAIDRACHRIEPPVPIESSSPDVEIS